MCYHCGFEYEASQVAFQTKDLTEMECLPPAWVRTLNTAKPNWTSGICLLNSGTIKPSQKTSRGPARAGEWVVTFNYNHKSGYIKGLRNWRPTHSDTVETTSSKNLWNTGCINLKQKQNTAVSFRYQPQGNIQRDKYTFPISISVTDLLFVNSKDFI